MKIDAIMQASIVSVEMDDTLNTIKDIFENVNFHHLLVVESNKIFGIISDRDLLKALSPTIGTVSETTHDLAILNQKAHQILTRNPITLTADAKISDAIDIFNNHNISCIPVVDEENKPIGIISWRDILKAI